jgi:hypothetical protein
MEALKIVDEYYKITLHKDQLRQLNLVNLHENTNFNANLITIANPIELTERARKCHNKLVLTCDFIETIKAFRVCLVLEKNDNSNNNMGDIVKLRSFVRKELDFGENEVDLNVESAWINFLYPISSKPLP